MFMENISFVYMVYYLKMKNKNNIKFSCMKNFKLWNIGKMCIICEGKNSSNRENILVFLILFMKLGGFNES